MAVAQKTGCVLTFVVNNIKQALPLQYLSDFPKNCIAWSAVNWRNTHKHISPHLPFAVFFLTGLVIPPRGVYGQNESGCEICGIVVFIGSQWSMPPVLWSERVCGSHHLGSVPLTSLLHQGMSGIYLESGYNAPGNAYTPPSPCGCPSSSDQWAAQLCLPLHWECLGHAVSRSSHQPEISLATPTWASEDPSTCLKAKRWLHSSIPYTPHPPSHGTIRALSCAFTNQQL